ncbi:MAG: hypothetical protein AAGA93_16755 [Actinomycetota bacterium]
MTETSYTAWDDKLYQWPPPDGWYEANDGKWWPEGYGPGPVEAEAETGPSAGADVDDGRDTATAGADADRAGIAGDSAGTAGATAAEATAAIGASAARAAEVVEALNAVEAAEAMASARTGGFHEDAGDRAGGIGNRSASVVDPGSDTGSDAAEFGRSADDGVGHAAEEVDEVSAALAETLAVRSDDGGSASPDLAGLTGSVAGAVDGLPGAARDTMGGAKEAVDGFADTVRDRADDRLGAADGFAGAAGDAVDGLAIDRSIDSVADGLSGAAARFGEVDAGGPPVDGPGSADEDGLPDADATQYVPGDLPDLGQRSRVDLDALPPPSFDPPPADEARPSLFGGPAAGPTGSPSSELDTPTTDLPPAQIPVSSDPTDLAGSAAPGGAVGNALDNAEHDAVARAEETLAGFPGEVPGDGDRSTLLPPPPDGSGLPTADLETLADVPSSRSDDPAVTGDVLGAATGPMADAGPFAGRPDETLVAPLDHGDRPGVGVPPPGGASWGSPPPDQLGAAPAPLAGSQPGGWDQPGYAPPPPGTIGLDAPSLQDPPSSGFSRILLVVALGVLALLALGALAFVLLGDDDESAATATGPGSFAEPHARTTGVEVFYITDAGEQRWVVEVLAPARDATAETTAALDAGQILAATSVRVRNQSAELPAPLAQLRFNAVTADDRLIARDGVICPELAGGLDGAATLPPAGVVEGVVCWPMTAADLGGLLLGIESTEVSGRIHITLQ